MKSLSSLPSSALPSLDDWMQYGLPWQNLAIEQSRVWFQVQARSLTVLERFSDDWLRRRRAGADAALKLVEGMAATEDSAERAELGSRWLTGLTERLGEDVRSLNDCLDDLSRTALAELRTEAGRESRADKGTLSPTDLPPTEEAGPRRSTRVAAAAAAAKQAA